MESNTAAAAAPSSPAVPAAATASTPAVGAGVRGLIVAGFFLSGLAGLVDQVVWSRYLALFIGSSTAALTIVLATFMAGLALGNHVFGRGVDRASGTGRGLAMYALLELGIGMYCLVFPEVLGLITDTYVRVAAPMGFGAPGTTSLKLALAASTILLPTFLMGGTLPVLARVLTTRIADVTSSVGRLYFLNSFGAAFGAALAGFYLVPTFGLEPTIRASGIINLALAVAFFVALRGHGARRRRDAQATGVTTSDALATDAPASSPGDGSDGAGLSEGAGGPDAAFSPLQRRVVFAVIGAAGAVSMLYEVVWTRLLSLVMGGSTYSFTIMVTTFITGITLGSLAVTRRFGPNGPGGDPVRWFAAAETGVFLSILPVVPLYDRLPFYFAAIASLLDREPGAFPLYLAVKVFAAFALMFLPTFFIGMTLPLASRVAVDRLAVLGRRVGSVFSINTVGTVLGASVTGLWLVPTLGLRPTLLLGIGLTGALAVALWQVVPGLDRRQRWAAPAVAVTLLAAVIAVGPWNQLVLNFGMYRHKEFAIGSYDELLETLSGIELLYAEDGADTSVAVLRNTERDTVYMKVNGKTDAGTGGDVSTQLWLGHLGLFMNPRAKDVLVIGLGSGITAGSVLAHDDVEHLTVVEISDAVVAGARFFGDHNGHALEDPRLTLHVGDAKELFKLERDARYDVVVSEPSNPWISGIGNLFSRQYFEEIAAHLSPGGALVQWVHLYELNDDLLRIILETVAAVFPYVEIWQCNEGDILIAGSLSPLAADRAHIEGLLKDPKVAADLNRPVLGRTLSRPEDFLVGQVMSAQRFRAFFQGTPPHNTDTHPLLEYQAPRAFFAGERANLPWRLDERRVPLDANDLHLARSLRQAPLGPQALDGVLQVMGARGSDADGAVLRSVAWGFVAMRAEGERQRGLVQQLVDPSIIKGLEAPDPRARLAAHTAMLEQATSVFFAPPVNPVLRLAAEVVAQPAASADDALAPLAALARAQAPEALASFPLPPDPRPVADPLGLSETPLPLAPLRDLYLGQAWLTRGPAGCAVAPLERVVSVVPNGRIAQGLLARARTLAADAPCPVASLR